TGTVIATASTATFNDQIDYITPEEFFDRVAGRVAAEAKQALLAYFKAAGYYPFAGDFADPSGNCQDGKLTGALPLHIQAGCTSLDEWTALPSWFATDGWNG